MYSGGSGGGDGGGTGGSRVLAWVILIYSSNSILSFGIKTKEFFVTVLKASALAKGSHIFY